MSRPSSTLAGAATDHAKAAAGVPVEGHPAEMAEWAKSGTAAIQTYYLRSFLALRLPVPDGRPTFFSLHVPDFDSRSWQRDTKIVEGRLLLSVRAATG